MSQRDKSISKLKNAVMNKTLTCYQVSDYDIEPVYFDSGFQTCCAVGELFDKKELFGLKDFELIELQLLHDECLSGDNLGYASEVQKKINEFENFVHSLK